MNAGMKLQRDWRWNGKPLRVRIRRRDGMWRISWERWFPRQGVWNEWRTFVGSGVLKDVLRGYRFEADCWRGFE